MALIIFIGLVVMGAVFGSFAVAQVWRIRARQLKFELESGEKIDKAEWRKLKHLTTVKQRDDRSHCLSCGYELRWYDLIPVVSWLSLGGKCRKCRKPIGSTEFLAEISLGLVFGLSFLLWPFGKLVSTEATYLEVVSFIVWLIIAVILTILFVYDAKWSLLPLNLMLIFIGLASVMWLINVFSVTSFSLDLLLNLALSMAALPGVYLVLNLISKGTWVGSGDWILSIGLVLLLPNLPILAVFVLFLSNFLGTIYILLESRVRGGIKQGMRIPFGPFLIIATTVVLLTYPYLINFLGFSYIK